MTQPGTIGKWYMQTILLGSSLIEKKPFVNWTSLGEVISKNMPILSHFEPFWVKKMPLVNTNGVIAQWVLPLYRCHSQFKEAMI